MPELKDKYFKIEIDDEIEIIDEEPETVNEDKETNEFVILDN